MNETKFTLIEENETLRVSTATQHCAVNQAVIKWAVNAVLNFAELTVVPYVATEHPVVKDETFVQKLLERMMNERKCFYKKPAVTKDGVTYFRGYYRFFRGVVKFNIPRNESIDKFLTEKGFINRKEFI